jgi:hypothetical protein
MREIDRILNSKLISSGANCVRKEERILRGSFLLRNKKTLA